MWYSIVRLVLILSATLFLITNQVAIVLADSTSVQDADMILKPSFSIEQLTIKAEAGDKDAQFTLGGMYFRGYGVPQDYKESVRWLRKSAEQGYVWAQYALGLMCYQGEGLPQDFEEALEWFTLAAELGYADAQFSLGTIYAKSEGVPQDYREAVKWFTKAAEQGHAGAQFFVASHYAEGQGVPQNYAEAVRWYTKAAEQGDASAQLKLGVMYANGRGVPQDYREAAKWFTTAAEQGFAEAQNNLGVMYYSGQGVPQDHKEAVKWFTKAAEQGLPKAQFCLGSMYAIGQGVPQDYEEAVKWWNRAAQQGFAEAQYALGLMYFLGRGAPDDYVLAYKWYNLAAAQGNQGAVEARDVCRQEMSPSQIAEAQRLSREFVPRKERVDAGETAIQRDARIKGFGSGFFVSDDGLFVTAAHVVQGASEVKIFVQNREYKARTLFADGSLDIAMLHVEGVGGVGGLSVVPSGPVRTGDGVFTLGFPQVQLQGAEAKFTDGSISSLSGIGGDPKFFQISVPVQPGNSGGPLVDASGNVVGIIVSRLDEIETLLATGSLPQNVNYALKSSFVLPLLESLPGVSERMLKPVKLERSAAIEMAKNAVGLVVCME